jgi:hypothetical protein
MKDKQSECNYIYVTIYRSWFSPGAPVSSTNKTDRHDITEILILKVALNTIALTLHLIPVFSYPCVVRVYTSLCTVMNKIEDLDITQFCARF